MERNKEKETPKDESWHEKSLGGDLFRVRAECIDVTVRSSVWSESFNKGCQMCDMGEYKVVEHVIL